MTTFNHSWPTSGGTPSNPPWTTIASGLSATNGSLVSISTQGIISYNATQLNSNQFIQSVWVIGSSLIFNGKQYLLLRVQDASNYILIDFDDGRHSVVVSTRIAGSNSTLFTSAAPNFIANDIVYADINNGIITLKKNSTTFASSNVSALLGILTSGNPGISMGGSSTDQGAWGIVSGGDFSEGFGVTYSSSVLSASYTFQSPIVPISPNFILTGSIPQPYVITYNPVTENYLSKLSVLGIPGFGNEDLITNVTYLSPVLSASYSISTPQINTNSIISLNPLIVTYSIPTLNIINSVVINSFFVNRTIRF